MAYGGSGCGGLGFESPDPGGRASGGSQPV